VFIWHLITFWSKQLSNGYHQVSNLTFSITSAANRHIKYLNYSEGYRTLSQISVWEFYYFSTALWKKTCQYKKIVLQWACTGQDHPPSAQPYLRFISPAKNGSPNIPHWLCRLSSQKEKRTKQHFFLPLCFACLKHFLIKPLASFLSQFIFSTKEEYAMHPYWKTFKHIYSFLKQTYKSSNCNKEQTYDSKT